MPKLKLTEKVVTKMAAPTPSGKQVLHWDTDLKGFAVLCSGVSNQRTYVVQRDVGTKTRRLTVASVAELAKLGGLGEARKRAADMLDQLRRGIDPKVKIENPTLQWALDNYLAARKDLRPASIRLYKQIETKLASWLDMPVRDITADMVEAKHRAIAAEVGPFTANATMRTFRIMWKFAAQRAAERGDVMPVDPVRSRLSYGKQWYPEPERERSVKTEELPRFYHAVCALENLIARDYLLLLLFTGMRRTEAATLRWENIDLTERVIRVPAAATKGVRNLDLPMSDFVHDLLVARRALGNAKFVFPGRGSSGHFADFGRPLAAIAKTCGVKVSAHDLRRTFTSIAETTDISPFALKAMINHSVGKGVTEGYIQMSELRERVQRVCDKLKTLCGIQPVEGGNIEKLKGHNAI